MAQGNGMIPDKVVELLQYRINQEELSSRMYLAMSEWLDYHGYFGAAKLWAKYSQEELTHARWAYAHLADHDILPIVDPLKDVKTDFESLIEIIYDSFKHEIDIANQCKKLVDVCMAEKDYITVNLAYKYANEQTEELGKLQKWIDRLATFGTAPTELRLLDEEMGDAA